MSENADVITAIEGDAGIFASDIVGNNSEVIGKMLYWTQDDCLFQASVPLVVLDSIIDQITAPNPLMQIVK